jgi:RNA polymerase sigma-70 factor (ECF subfamily)
MRRLARRFMRRDQPEQQLCPTELVHETYLRLVGGSQPTWESRTHFYAVAARLMRQVLVDLLRGQRAQKRGGGTVLVPLDSVRALSDESQRDVLAIHDALLELSVFDERKSRILEMRFFGGMTSEEIAEVVGVASVTINREIRAAMAWLRVRLTETAPAAGHRRVGRGTVEKVIAGLPDPK